MLNIFTISNCLPKTTKLGKKVSILTSPFPTQNYCLSPAYGNWDFGIMHFLGDSKCMSPIPLLRCSMSGRIPGRSSMSGIFRKGDYFNYAVPEKDCLEEEDLFKVWTWEKGLKGYS
jgi:hypothetical protein